MTALSWKRTKRNRTLWIWLCGLGRDTTTSYDLISSWRSKQQNKTVPQNKTVVQDKENKNLMQPVELIKMLIWTGLRRIRHWGATAPSQTWLCTIWILIGHHRRPLCLAKWKQWRILLYRGILRLRWTHSDRQFILINMTNLSVDHFCRMQNDFFHHKEATT